MKVRHLFSAALPCLSRLFRVMAAIAVLSGKAVGQEPVVLADTITGYTTEFMPGLPNSLGDTTGVFAAIPMRVLPANNTVLSRITLIGFGTGPDSNLTGSPDFSEFQLSIGVYSSIQAFEANYYRGDLHHVSIPNQPQFFTHSAHGTGMESPFGGNFTTYRLDFTLQSLNISLPANDAAFIVLYLNALPAAGGDFYSSITSRGDLPPSILYYGGPGPIQGYSGTEFWPGTSGLAAYRIEGITSGPAVFDMIVVSAGPITQNAATGIWQQSLVVRNRGAEATRFRLTVTGLPAGAARHNASGRSAEGVPFILMDEPLAAGSERTLTLEYDLPAGQTITPAFTLAAPTGPPPPAGAPFTIDHVLRPAGGVLVMEFPSEPGRHYQVQHSDDLSAWTPGGAPITAAGTRVQWLDAASTRARFYRVLREE